MRLPRFAEALAALLLLGTPAATASESIEDEFVRLIDRSRPTVGTFSRHLPGKLPYFVTKEFHPVWTRGAAPTGSLAIPAFSFTDQRDRPFTERDLRGRVSVASFFFASCADFCPLIVRQLKRVQAEFAHEPRVQLLSHSVTPDVDTPARLAAYGRAQKLDADRWRLLTGDRAEIYTLARTGYFADTKVPGAPTDQEFIHSDSVYLLDEAGYIRGLYRGSSPPSVQHLINDIKLLLDDG